MGIQRVKLINTRNIPTVPINLSAFIQCIHAVSICYLKKNGLHFKRNALFYIGLLGLFHYFCF